MKLLPVLLLCTSLAVTGCVSTTGASQGAKQITPEQAAEMQYQVLDSINSLRTAKGLAPVQLNAQLNAAAATHSRDMAVQNRPWHFGSDGSSPLDRVRRVGYSGTLLGENISETYETALETLSDWMAQPDTRAVILDPTATEIGFAWFQEPSGKMWWTLVSGTAANIGTPASQLG
ncbi:CAP domain-containing protein [Tabrizicola sp. J26]|uniref:CAP domain-containing protein n=1 Tax=Alitabrizicola rongguiensis TaxID=2909234 RepID=UPI001F4103B8|nr:CAP domain-containing protein [Tabrizicola rongguiensis]MCF1708171.1 CAP domain-containing protein [Tabrizicola rongguiensis]